MEHKDAEIPAADDLARWKLADSYLSVRFIDPMGEDRFQSARALKGYFGNDDAVSLLVAHEEQAVLQAYTTWAILHYRPGKKSRTYAQKMLAEGLPEPERMLLRARIGSYPSLYRVSSPDAKAGTVVLEDLLLGGAVTVYDQMFAKNIDEGVLVAARVFPAG